MPGRVSAQESVRFGPLTLDLNSAELWNGSERVLLPDQAFRILAALVRRPGTVITRDELRRELWADDTFVDFEHSLNAAVKRLRQMLGDSATAPRFIETVPRRGYRFIAEVHATVRGSAATALAPVITPADTANVDGRLRVSRGRRWTATILAALLGASGIIANWWLRDHRASASSDSFANARLVRLTATAGVNVDPALSPDGSLVAFASDRAGPGNLDVWVQPIAGGTPVRITTDPAEDVEPSFSQDGSQIVFVRRETGGIYVVDALGGEARRIVAARRAHNPRFSPDGRWIAYWTGLPVAISHAAGASGSLFVVAASGGEPRRLLTGFANARHPIWSIDGQRLLFVGERIANEAGLDWYVTSFDGSHVVKTGAFDVLQRAGAASSTDRPIPGAWTSAGTVLTTTTARSSSNIWAIHVSSNTGRVTGEARRITFGTALERSPTIAKSGRIAFASVSENADVWRVPLDDATGTARGPIERVTDNPAMDMMLNISADGRVLAFASSRSGATDVWLKDVHGGDERRLTHSGAIDGRLNEDASRAIVWTDGPEASRIEMVDVKTGTTSIVCVDCERTFGFTPDGRVLFARNAPSRLIEHDLASGHEREIVSHPSWLLRQGRYSPDGRWIVFYAAKAPEVRHIYIIPSDRPSRTPEDWIPVVTDAGTQPSWSRDGRAIYYLSERDGALCAWVQLLDPVTKRPIGPPRAVQHFHQPGLLAGTTAIATNDVQDGFLYITLTQSTGNLWLLEPDQIGK